MKNKDRFREKILEIACNGDVVAVVGGEPCSCRETYCVNCDFYEKSTAAEASQRVKCAKQCEEWCEAEYVEPTVDWSKVAVDTPILVRDKECYTWKKRYFAKYEDEYVYAWNDGADSWSSNGFASPWRIAKLAEDEQGKLTRLPCQVDDKIYAIVHDYEKDTEVIEESRIIRVTQNVNGWFFESLINIPAFRSHDFGKIVFLTREEAEAKLKEMEDSNGERN